MAKSQNFQIQSRTDRAVIIAGSFRPNGTGAVSASTREGCGFAVARTSAGLFTITLTDKFTAMVSATATLQLSTKDDKFPQVGDIDLSAKTVKIRVWDVSSADVDDVADDANNKIHFCFVLLASSSARRRGG